MTKYITLKDKVALVTGATGKVSQQIVRHLGRCGVSTALHYNTHETLANQLAEELAVTGLTSRVYQADLSDCSGPKQLAGAVLKDFGKVDILINTASQFVPARMDKTDAGLWQKMFDIHATSVWRLVSCLADNFRHLPGSAIVNLTDIWAIRPKKTFLAYSVSKAALTALTAALAQELAPTTTVNAVAPGIINIEPDTPSSIREKILSRIPAGRLGSPDDIASLVVEICKWRYVTGITIAVDGGRSLV